MAERTSNLEAETSIRFGPGRPLLRRPAWEPTAFWGRHLAGTVGWRGGFQNETITSAARRYCGDSAYALNTLGGTWRSMRWRSVSEANCSVARTLSVIGERWTMLILREAFLGRRRFDDFQRNTGIARNILAARLRALVGSEILERAEGQDEHARVEYRLTKKGMDLYPVMVAMLRWGDTWLCGDKGPPLTLVHRGCGAKATPAFVCPSCGENVSARDMLAVPRRSSHSARRPERGARKRSAR